MNLANVLVFLCCSAFVAAIGYTRCHAYHQSQWVDIMDTLLSLVLHLPKFAMQTKMLDGGMTELVGKPMYDKGTDGGNRLDDDRVVDNDG